MNIIDRTELKLAPKDYYEKHLMVISAFLPVQMTPKEREVIAAFMARDGDLAKVDRFATYYRKQVETELKLSTGGLTNHLSALKKKGFIIDNITGISSLREWLFPDDSEQGYRIKITKDGSTN